MNRRSWRIVSLTVIGAGIAIAVASEDLRAQLRVESIMEPTAAVSPSSYCYRETTIWPTWPGITSEPDISWFGNSFAGRQQTEQFLEAVAGLSSDGLQVLEKDIAWAVAEDFPQSGPEPITKPMVHRELLFVCYPEPMPAVSPVEHPLFPHWTHSWREWFDSQ